MRILPENLSGVIVALILAGCSSDGSGRTGGQDSVADAPPRIEISVVSEYPHDATAFTQGLEFGDPDRLLESTGGRGTSDVREVEPFTGEVLSRDPLPGDLFGEGLTVGPDRVVQLTWTSGRVLQRDAGTLETTGEWEIGTEGWGVVWDAEGERYLTSDGSSMLSARDRDDFSVIDTIAVTESGSPVDDLNELEWVEGDLYANVWMEDRILRIDPATGDVTGVIDASPVVEAIGVASDRRVLNGIAHRPGDPPTRLWITGKEWPTMFVVDLIET